MPRERQPARLWLRKAAKDREAVWVILDSGQQISTGCCKDDYRNAEGKFAKYLASRFIKAPKAKERPASEISVAEVVANYLELRGKKVARPKELAQRMDAILDWWHDKTLDDISTLTCTQYAESRTSISLARRELEDLRAAVNQAIRDKLCRHAVVVTLPEKSQSRTDHLEIPHVAKLLWAAYRKREVQNGRRTKKKPTIHVARFVICALYTGSRSARVWRASFHKEQGRPFVDVDAGLFYRRWEGEAASKKQAPPIRLPRRLLAHLRRWKAMGARYVVEYQGRAADPKKAFRLLARTTLDDVGFNVVRHTLRHTLATWLMRRGVPKFEAQGYLGMTAETLENVYAHHDPEHQGAVDEGISTKAYKARR